MPRILTTTQRNALEDPNSSEVYLTFATVTHADLAEALRWVTEGNGGVSADATNGETINYNLDSSLYLGFPFSVEWVTDDERPPRAQIQIPDVTGTIGQALRRLSTAPVISLAEYAYSDWAPALDANNARSPTGTPTLLRAIPRLRLRSARGDFVFEADLSPPDPTAEPWPSMRATVERLPGLFF